MKYGPDFRQALAASAAVCGYCGARPMLLWRPGLLGDLRRTDPAVIRIKSPAARAPEGGVEDL